MIVVFEGIEGAGKSTLSERFASSANLRVYNDPARHGQVPFDSRHRTPREWQLLGNQANLDIAEFSTMTHFVVDRWALSSMTYDFLRNAYAGDDFYKDLASSIDHQIYLLDCSPFVAHDRLLVRDGKARAKPLEYLSRHRDRFLEVALKWNSWSGRCAVIDANDADLCWKHLHGEASRLAAELG